MVILACPRRRWTNFGWTPRPSNSVAQVCLRARFVWERERLGGYRKPPPWTAWLEQWNDEHPGHRIKSASNFRAPDLYLLEVTGGLAQALRLIGFMTPVRSSIVAQHQGRYGAKLSEG
jgi:hypothetical protein